MNPFLKVRILDRDKQIPGGVMSVEVSASTGPEKHIFIILDLSDSCGSIILTLKKLAWLWQRIPKNWQITIFALSNPEPIYPDSGHMFSQDLCTFLCNIDKNHQWSHWMYYQSNRGSFFQPTLDGIQKIFSSQQTENSNSLIGAIAIILTDGELLDPDPVKIPSWLTCFGLLNKDKKDKKISWDNILKGIPLFDLNSVELESWFAGIISPAMNLCEITPSFDCTFFNSGKIRNCKRTMFKWNFGKGPLTLLVDPTDFIRTHQFIDVRLNKNNFRLDLSRFSTESKLDGFDGKSATIANKGLALIDDPTVVKKLIHELRKCAANRESISNNFISLLLSTFNDSQKFDNAIVIIVSKDSNQQTLLVGKLFKNYNCLLFMKGTNDAPPDPGISPKRNLTVQYNQDDARWHLMHGEEKMVLPPRNCGLISGVFFDTKKTKCEAFYTGPLKEK